MRVILAYFTPIPEVSHCSVYISYNLYRRSWRKTKKRKKVEIWTTLKKTWEKTRKSYKSWIRAKLTLKWSYNSIANI